MVIGAFVGGTGGLIAAVLVLGVAARVGDVALSVAVVFVLVGAVGGGTVGWLLAPRSSRRRE